jgi:Glycosyltransferase like family
MAFSGGSKMNAHLFAFICCVNDEKTYDFHVKHINKLVIPPGYAVELVPVYGASSMTKGYNEGMRRTNAKYKVYLHQDTFIINEHFIRDCLNVFLLDERIGMLGVVGSKHVPPTGSWWDGKPQYGLIEAYFTNHITLRIGEVEGLFAPVEIIDGVIMITQYDLEWDERLDGFHYYDITQSIRFNLHGYRVVVPAQQSAWVYHHCLDDANWDQYRQAQRHFMHMYRWPFFGGEVKRRWKSISS